MNNIIKNMMRIALMLWLLSNIVAMILQSHGTSISALLGTSSENDIKEASLMPMLTLSFSLVTLWEIIVVVFPAYKENPRAVADAILNSLLSFINKPATK